MAIWMSVSATTRNSRGGRTETYRKNSNFFHTEIWNQKDFEAEVCKRSRCTRRLTALLTSMASSLRSHRDTLAWGRWTCLQTVRHPALNCHAWLPLGSGTSHPNNAHILTLGDMHMNAPSMLGPSRTCAHETSPSPAYGTLCNAPPPSRVLDRCLCDPLSGLALLVPGAPGPLAQPHRPHRPARRARGPEGAQPCKEFNVSLEDEIR